MPRSERFGRERQVAIVREALSRPRFLWVQAAILVHERRSPGPPCPCCGSRLAGIVDTILDAEVVIDTRRGGRVTGKVNPEAFDKLKKRGGVRRVAVNLRCSRKQLPLLLDDGHKLIGALGGNRSGKTTIGIYWIVRQWIRKGGRGAQFWLVSYERQQTHTLMDKLILGEFTSSWVPPALPMHNGRPLLAKSWPESVQSADQTIRMVDGSVFKLLHARKRGGNMKGKAVQAILGDEWTEVPHKENHTIALARLTESHGSMFVSTTPMAGHWLKEELIDRVDAGSAPDLTYATLSQVDNPWVPEDEVERLIRSIGDELTVRREVHGEWIGNKGSLWKHFDPDIHVLDGDSYDVEDYLPGCKNVTKVACLKFWRGRNPYTRVSMRKDPKHVAGQDFNTDYMNMVICQVFETPNGARGLFVVDEIVLRDATSVKFAHWVGERRGKRTRMRCYPAVPIACDPAGAYYNVHSVKSDRQSSTDAKDMARGGFDCRPCRVNPKTGNPQSPPIHDRVSLVQKLLREHRMVLHARCSDTIKSLLTQEDDGRGRPIKASNTASDRLSGPTDALGYVVWPLFSTEYETRGRGFVDPDQARPII